MICKNDITTLKSNIGEIIGRKIIIKGSHGRNKPFEKAATVESAYSNLFIVKYDEGDRNVSYTYTDVLTRNVEVEVYDGENYSPLLPPVDPKIFSKKNRYIQT